MWIAIQRVTDDSASRAGTGPAMGISRIDTHGYTAQRSVCVKAMQ